MVVREHTCDLGRVGVVVVVIEVVVVVVVVVGVGEIWRRRRGKWTIYRRCRTSTKNHSWKSSRPDTSKEKYT